MLYDVGVDALDSLETSSNVSVFTYTRHYQYVVTLNTQAPVLRSKIVRQALNLAIDRPEVVREALNGHGIISSGPIWPRNFAYRPDAPALRFDAPAAAALLSSASKQSKPSPSLHFTCLVPSDAPYERIALVMKRQLKAVGVEMSVEEASMDRILEAFRHRTFEAALVEAVSGPTLLRPYELWHSNGSGNPGGFGNASVDAALDQIRHAASDAEYVEGVSAFQRTIVDDPPAIFLAWIQRARAVSKKFSVPAGESGRDILSTLRLWKPASGAGTQASRN